MRVELAGLNHCAVPLSSRAAINLCWYHIICGHGQVLQRWADCTSYVRCNTIVPPQVNGGAAYKVPRSDLD